jgi:hypothetical protein
MATKKRRSWVSRAIKRPGDLRRKAAAAGAITRDDKIDIRWARKMARGGPNVDPLTARQARFYVNVLRPMNMRRAEKRREAARNSP